MIRLVGIEKDYEMGDEVVPALREVDLHVPRGSFVAIMGPSGSGKSTLMNILGCLDRPTRGQYFLDGQDVSHLDDDELAGVRNQKIGFVFQSFNLLHHATAAENVALPLIYAGADDQNERALRALEKVALKHRANHHPTELSGGQRQRVAIARAIITEPPLILADEPTGNLDSTSGQEVMHILQQLNRERGITIILVTHDPRIGHHAQRIIHLFDGKVLREETVAEPIQALGAEDDVPTQTAEYDPAHLEEMAG